MIRIIVGIIFLVLLSGETKIRVNSSMSCEVSKGTTGHLREIVIGRCHDFFNTIHKNDCEIRIQTYDCEMIWNQFEQVVIGKDLCDVKVKDFDHFFNLTDIDIGANKSLLWSGTYTPAHESNFLNSFDEKN